MEALERRGVASRVGFSQGRLRRRREVRADGVDVPVPRRQGGEENRRVVRRALRPAQGDGRCRARQPRSVLSDARQPDQVSRSARRGQGEWDDGAGRAQAGHGDDRVARVRAGDARVLGRVRQVASDGPDLPMGRAVARRRRRDQSSREASPGVPQGVLQARVVAAEVPGPGGRSVTAGHRPGRAQSSSSSSSSSSSGFGSERGRRRGGGGGENRPRTAVQGGQQRAGCDEGQGRVLQVQRAGAEVQHLDVGD
mmetsp:Transcript_9967/g.40917  ORF Transcript_9967/g.40917 Transcript_9967/m.40917 type:complete len:253 (+) Transcript_9967:3379-4137(+)